VFADYGNEGNVYFSDDFESGDLSAWDGYYDNGAEVVTSTSDGGSPASGSYCLELQGQEAVRKTLPTLDSDTDVHVRATVRAESMDSDVETGDIEHYEAGSGWTPVAQVGWEYNQQGWLTTHAIIPSDADFIRFRNAGNKGADYFFVDDVVVSDILHEYTTPSAPSNVSISAGSREATVSYTPEAAFASGHDINPVEGTPDLADGSVQGESRTFTDLLDGERYAAEVRAFIQQYRRGTSSQYFHSGFVGTGTSITDLPGPLDLTVSNITATSSDYGWTPQHNYGETEVQYKPSDASEWQTYGVVGRDVTQEVVDGLRNLEEYDARVVATTEHTSTEDQ
jgi:hypothetical protein